MNPFVRVARFDDYPQIEAVMRANAAAIRPEREWREMWIDNPLWARVGDRWPIGWSLDDGRGRIVGSIVSVPSLYRFRGRELLCANGRAWAVLPEYRGLALWLMDEYFNQPGVDLFVNTTVAPRAAATAEQLSRRVPVGDWQQVPYWVVGYRRFARSVLRDKRVPLVNVLSAPAAAMLAVHDFVAVRELPVGDRSVAIEQIQDFDSRFDVLWHELVRTRPDRLIGVRDRETLAWHYAVLRGLGRLRIFTASRAGLLRAYGVFTISGPEEELQRMRLVDYQSVDGQQELLLGLVRAALERCGAEGVSVLEYWGAGVPSTRDLDAHAPHHRELACWPFYYRTNDPALSAELARPEVWDPSLFDGDASFD
jgi:hypothetical protein